jgi:AcrR family transcriptional regulator
MAARDGTQTRQALLAAGAAVGGDGGLPALTVTRVIESAGSSKGAFFHHFSSREEFILELHRAFHERMFHEISAAMARADAGRDRLIAGARAFWRICLAERAMRACLIEARVDPIIADEARRLESEMAREIESDLRAMGVAGPRALAPLLLAAVREVAILEHEHGAPLPAVRRSFESLLSSGRTST